jgi:hypothetical protein
VGSVLGWFIPYLGAFFRENYPKHHPRIKPSYDTNRPGFFLNTGIGTLSFSTEYMMSTVFGEAIYIRLPDDIHKNWKLCNHSRYVSSFIMLLEYNSLHIVLLILFWKNNKKSI